MANNATDRVILKSIYNLYYHEYASFQDDETTRSSKLYVPIDFEKIAKTLDLDADIVFGRLYYHLDKKYSYKQNDGSFVNLFLLGMGRDKHVVHFPLLAAVLAEEEQSFTRFTIPIILSLFAIAVSIFTLVFK